MEEAIILKLLQTSGVAAKVGTRIYPGARPQASALPAIAINRISGAPLYADDGETGLAESRLQIDCWAGTYSEAKLTARAVIDSLSAFVGTVGGVTFPTIMLDAERDLLEPGLNAAEYLFHTSLDFIIWQET
jgi:hypothetical protein